MRRLSVPSVLCVGAGLAVIAAALPSPAHASRDICVKVLEPVKSVARLGLGAGRVGGQAATSEVWTVEVTMGDCMPPPPVNVGPFPLQPAGWPPMSFSAGLNVSSGGTAICGTTTHATVGGPGPMPRIFRFRLVYPPSGGGQTPASVTTQALPVPYVIRATAQVADGTPANNEGVATFRFTPGGTASCVQLQTQGHK